MCHPRFTQYAITHICAPLWGDLLYSCSLSMDALSLLACSREQGK